MAVKSLEKIEYKRKKYCFSIYIRREEWYYLDAGYALWHKQATKTTFCNLFSPKRATSAPGNERGETAVLSIICFGI